MRNNYVKWPLFQITHVHARASQHARVQRMITVIFINRRSRVFLRGLISYKLSTIPISYISRTYVRDSGLGPNGPGRPLGSRDLACDPALMVGINAVFPSPGFVVARKRPWVTRPTRLFLSRQTLSPPREGDRMINSDWLGQLGLEPLWRAARARPSDATGG